MQIFLTYKLDKLLISHDKVYPGRRKNLDNTHQHHDILEALLIIHKAKLSAFSNQLTAFCPLANTVLIVYITKITIISSQLIFVIFI